MPWLPLAIGGVLGAAKSELIDKPKADKQRKLAAETQRWSPWTGMSANPVQEADPFGSALQFGTAGGMMGQNMAAQGQTQQWLDMQKQNQAPGIPGLQGGMPMHAYGK